MTSFILDTLAYSETLKAGGFSEQQAVTQARALAEILDRQMATKAEVAEHENALRRKLVDSRSYRSAARRTVGRCRIQQKPTQKPAA
ncbi:hypothetical protein [uncultured Lamprocystis sp.]|jgi:hypothetical protein|uniref:hypothetical protein n=1 Tax=uncultured Lamprocystis sp. TaxID=543132 RepID=UPI0025E5B030|nr:hypothetical protein [uncultured Lamprocystis sp.]